MSQHAQAAVITGDIVKSGALEAARFAAVMDALAEAAAAMSAWPQAGTVRYERFRGDGWQLFLEHAGQALRAACVMRAALRAACEAAETRLAIGVGPATCGASLGSSTGPAFERSGQALDGLASHRLWAWGGRLCVPAADTLADALIGLCDDRSQAWSARQAFHAGRLLDPEPLSLTALAEAESVSVQTVHTHFQRAGGHALREACTAFYSAING